MRDRLRLHLARNLLETDDRIVGRAAAEIGDENIRVPLQVLGKVEGRRDRLHDELHIRETEAGERRAIPLHGQVRIGIHARKADGAAGDDPRDVRRPAVAGIGHHAAREDFQQVFERVPTGVNNCRLEERACRKGLDRLKEAAFARIFDEAADGRSTCFHLQRKPAEILVLHEGEAGAQAFRHLRIAGEAQRPGRIASLGGQHGVGRAEIEAEGGHGKSLSGREGGRSL